MCLLLRTGRLPQLRQWLLSRNSALNRSNSPPVSMRRSPTIPTLPPRSHLAPWLLFLVFPSLLPPSSAGHLRPRLCLQEAAQGRAQLVRHVLFVFNCPSQHAWDNRNPLASRPQVSTGAMPPTAIKSASQPAFQRVLPLHPAGWASRNLARSRPRLRRGCTTCYSRARTPRRW